MASPSSVPPVPARPAWRAVAIVWAVALAVIASGAPALGQGPPRAAAHVVVDTLADGGTLVIDTLADGGTPSPAEIASSVRRLDVRVAPIELPEPRRLGQQVRDGDRTTLVVATDVLFAFDDTRLSPRARRTVQDLAADLVSGQDVAASRVRVVGHTDSVGSDAYNQRLSERRAEAVASVLAEVLGTDLPIAAEGRGEREPVADEDDGGARAAARNRRVEILVEA